MRITIVVLLTAGIFIAGPIHAVFGIPADGLLKSLRPSADVNDFAGLLSPAEREQLEARCRKLRERTGAQLGVVTLKSLDGGQIDDFASKLFKHWGIGQKDKKNGVLLIVAIADRKARIEVGYGLEPIIPDALAGRIIDRELKPNFRTQHYAAGLQASVNTICERIEAGTPAAPNAPHQQNKPADTFVVVFILAVFIAFAGLVFGASLRLPKYGMAIFGLMLGGGGILAGLAAGGILSLLLHVPAAILGAALGWNVGRAGFQIARPMRRNWGSSPSPWTLGNYGGSSGGGWSSGGGGFSQGWGGFGGGSSGGGGASGGW